MENNSSQQSNVSTSSKSKLPYIGGAVIVLIIILGAGYYLLGTHMPSAATTANKTTSTVTTSTNTVTNNTAPKQTSNTSTSGTTSTGGTSSTGSGKYVLTGADASSLVGSGGVYTTKTANQSIIASEPASYGITAAYAMFYNVTVAKTQTGTRVAEFVYQTQNLSTYNTLITSFGGSLNQTNLKAESAYNISVVNNATLSGVTYSSANFTSTQPDYGTVRELIIIGKGNNLVFYLTASSNTTDLNQPEFVSKVVADLN